VPSASDKLAPLEPGLYIVSTPLGNLEDITLRALRVLKSASVIACEDTRQTRKLLEHYGISAQTVSYHEHNELTRAAELVKQIEEGAAVALVSDAGTPGISDPGYRLITFCVRHHVKIIPIPGAAAFVAALVASGLPTDSFRFSGFLSPRSGARRTELEEIAASPRTQVYYEAPHRILETLADIVAVLGPQRRVVIAREVTKMHEEFLRGPAAQVLEELRTRSGGVRGEITLLIAHAEPEELAAAAATVALKKKDASVRLNEIMESQQLDEKSALKVLAKEMNVSKSEAYREVQRTKK
jgi:16S rRNA (cytidine1402-2'-O)-methyltransferase